MDTLERHHRCGALAAVCVGIRDRFFFVPWPVWRDMKEAFGHMSVSAAELEDFRVRFTGAVLFLDYVHKIGGRWITGTVVLVATLLDGLANVIAAMRKPERSVRRTSYSDGTSIVQIDNATAADVDRAVRAINGAESGRTGR